MIQHPAVISLLLSSFLITVMCLYASFYGMKILSGWDMGSGSEQQLELERRTYLISTILGYTLFFQIISFFLLIYTADAIHIMFTGAMCAAGSLAANGYGYPLLILKLVNAVLCGIWLAINLLDNKGYDYPLIKKKYAALAAVSLLIMIEAVTQYLYFSNLKPDLITSCCGSLFSAEKKSIAGELAAMPVGPATALFAGAYALQAISGAAALWKGRGWQIFGISSLLFFLAAIASIISFISLYFYELPTHHCPFCILQRDYLHIGYILYLCLIIGVVSGVSAGVGQRCYGIKSLAIYTPSFQKRAAISALLCNSIFTAITVCRILTTPFRL